MYKYIGSLILSDEAVPLTVIKPFYFTLKSCHCLPSLITEHWRPIVLAKSPKRKRPGITVGPRPCLHKTIARYEQRTNSLATKYIFRNPLVKRILSVK